MRAMTGMRTAKTTEGVALSGRDEQRPRRGAGSEDAPWSMEAEACAMRDCSEGGSFV